MLLLVSLQDSIFTIVVYFKSAPLPGFDAMTFVGHCGIEPHLLTERFYRPLITPVTEASLLYLVVESNYCHFHVKEIRSHYANEAKSNSMLPSSHKDYELVTVSSYPLKVMLLLPDIKSIVLHFKA